MIQVQGVRSLGLFLSSMKQEIAVPIDGGHLRSQARKAKKFSTATYID